MLPATKTAETVPSTSRRTKKARKRASMPAVIYFSRARRREPPCRRAVVKTAFFPCFREHYLRHVLLAAIGVTAETRCRVGEAAAAF